MPIRRPGWTPVPHAILEELARAPLPAAHAAVVAAIVRKTTGWHLIEITIRVADLAEACGIHPRSVRRAIVDLEHWRVVVRRGGGQGRAARFRICPPAGWRIGATVDALARRAVRLRAGQAVQLELGLAGVGDLSILPLPRVTSRDRHGAPARDVRPPPHPSRKKESVVTRAPAKVRAPRRDPAAWLDVTGTHQALSRRLEDLGLRAPDDLWHRVGKALAHGRARGRMADDPLAYAEFWVLDDIRKLGGGPIRRREDKPVDPTPDERPQPPTPEERRLAAAGMRLRWRTGKFPSQADVEALAAKLSVQDVVETFVELNRRREKAADRDADRHRTQAGRDEFRTGARRRR